MLSLAPSLATYIGISRSPEPQIQWKTPQNGIKGEITECYVKIK